MLYIICTYVVIFPPDHTLPEETDEGEIASALDGGVGVLVVRATEVVEVVG